MSAWKYIHYENHYLFKKFWRIGSVAHIVSTYNIAEFCGIRSKHVYKYQQYVIVVVDIALDKYSHIGYIGVCCTTRSLATRIMLTEECICIRLIEVRIK